MQKCKSLITVWSCIITFDSDKANY